jgi:hypothetical protein
MKIAARTITLPVLAAVAFATAGIPNAGACADRPGPCAARAAWMPDVAQRRAELEARFERFASEAGTNTEARSQWWRGAASRPTTRGPR